MSFEHDIMISYAWRDNQPPPLSESEGWVSNLQLVLEYWLRQLMSKQPKVWRDKNQMPGNKVFAEELDEIVAKVAILITVVSEPYLSSEWCARELENFIEHAESQGGLQVENDYRIFKINKLPVDRKVIPEPLKAVTGFDFYEADPETRIMTPIDPALGKEEKEEFSKKVYNVANAMSRLLKAIEAKGIQPKPETVAADANDKSTTISSEVKVDTGKVAAASTAATAITVYLPHTSRDLRDIREDLVSELQRRGCNVIPDQQPAWVDMDEFNKSMADDLAKADIAVHLLGARYGSILEGETRSVTELQIDLAAAESARRGLRRLIWLPKEMGEVNAQQTAFIQRLRGDRKSLEGADLLEDTLENLKSTVIDMLKPKPAVQSAPAEDGTEGSLQLYVMHDASDKDAVRELRKALKGKQAGGRPISLVLPVFEGEAAELRELQRQKLRECDAVLVFWGGSSQAWIDASLNEIRKAPGFGRSKKFGGKHLVYLSGAKTSPKNDWVLDAKDGLLEDDLHTVEAWTDVPQALLDDHLKTLTRHG